MTIIQQLPEVTQPLTHLNKTKEIVDVLNDNLGLYYSALSPSLTPVEGIATWTVTHNLGTKNVDCSVYNGDDLVICDVSTTSDNTVSINFRASATVPAETYKVVVVANGAAGSSSGGSSITVDSTLSSSSTNPVQNKVIYSALNDKLNTSVSNLTSAGQKVFDGQWVRIYEMIASGFQVSNNTSGTWKYETPITNFSWLPNDNYTYEINLGYWLTCTGTGNGTNAFCLVSHFNETINDYLPQAFVYNISGTKYSIPATGTTRILMGSTRSIRLISFIGTVGEIDLVATAYRRIGTNS